VDKQEVSIGGIVIAVIGIYYLCTHVLWPPVYTAIWESPTTIQAQSKQFTSKEECIEWINIERSSHPNNSNYECGKNCTAPKTEAGLFKCDDTYE
jgi:hypothetical protein